MHVFGVKQLQLKFLSQEWVAMYMYEIGLFKKFIDSPRALPQKYCALQSKLPLHVQCQIYSKSHADLTSCSRKLPKSCGKMS